MLPRCFGLGCASIVDPGFHSQALSDCPYSSCFCWPARSGIQPRSSFSNGASAEPCKVSALHGLQLNSSSASTSSSSSSVIVTWIAPWVRRHTCSPSSLNSSSSCTTDGCIFGTGRGRACHSISPLGPSCISWASS